MVVGGTDTTSNSIEFALAEMMNQPEILKRAQHELEMVVGKDNIVEESHINKLPYLHAIMKETLRLHPALPLLVPHCPSYSCVIGGYTVPKGARVFVNAWAIHRDPATWENPLEFRPERFLDAKWDYTGNDFRYFPFGSGRRICAGTAMGERMFMFLLGSIIQSFNWELGPGIKHDLSEKFGIVLKKKVALMAIPTPRLSNPKFSSFLNMDGHFTSGPLNNDLLWLSGSHRGDYYFQNPDRDDGILRIRRGDQDFWMHLNSNPIPENVMEFITLAGFGGIIQCGNRRLDRALISALVERWRPETHTFHLPVGETTVTLQDVNILGPVFLLQLWAWERLSGFAPETVNNIDFQKPYGARWRSSLTYIRTASHVLSAYRSQLHSLTEDKFNWRPYDNVFNLLPGICLSGQASWRCETYLICWEIVEPHLPSRVMRQFRMFQPVPVNTLFGEQEHRRLHKISRTSGRNFNWLQKHNQYVLSWVGRHNHVVTEELTDSCVASPEYMQWYLPRTILYTIDPRHHQPNQHGFPNDGGTLQMTWDIMSQIYQRSGEDFIRDMASQAMRYGQVEHHMGYYPTHMSQDPVGYQVPLVPQSIRRRNRRQAQAQNVDPEVQAEPVINSPHLSSMDHSSGNQLHSPSLNFGEVGLFKSIIDYSLLPQLNTPPAPGFRHLPDMRPPRDRSLSLELDMFDLNTSMDYTNKDNDNNDNLATRRGRRQIRRPGCGTH
ncbi:hypothetical protein E3N88_30447 [Mikania micrantha]|uniref:Aminotransferase-like plant mobile domain-containing protein n=1 Tax=Mikania micrantha TaxID=192012 RepID=A0A5N6MM32_9ASTR|nr:hypothetical protein E3N88_30447 [Mikania micrantha]